MSASEKETLTTDKELVDGPNPVLNSWVALLQDGGRTERETSKNIERSWIAESRLTAYIYAHLLYFSALQAECRHYLLEAAPPSVIRLEPACRSRWRARLTSILNGRQH